MACPSTFPAGSLTADGANATWIGADVCIELPDGKTALDLALASRNDQESRAAGSPRASSERVDSVYLLQEAEDLHWEREEGKALAAVQAKAQLEVAKATHQAAQAVQTFVPRVSVDGSEAAGAA